MRFRKFSLREKARALRYLIKLPDGWIRTVGKSRWWDAKYLAFFRPGIVKQ